MQAEPSKGIGAPKQKNSPELAAHLTPADIESKYQTVSFKPGGPMTTMITILGAGGPIGNELAKILAASNQPFRLVSRKPTAVAGAEVLAADLADGEQCIRAVAGSRVVHLLVGLKYDLGVWQELWPRIMANTIEPCKRAQANLIFFRQRLHVREGEWTDDRGDPIRSLLEEGRDSRKDRYDVDERS